MLETNFLIRDQFRD